MPFNADVVPLNVLAAVWIAAIASVLDVRSRRIPNALTFGAAAAAVIARFALGGPAGAIDAVLGWFTGLALLLIPYLLGGMGAGDVKLVAALGAWLGPAEAVWFGVYTYIAAGAMGLVVAIAHRYLGEAMRNIWLLLTHWSVAGVRPMRAVTLEGSKGPRLAYAAPVLVGTLITLWRH